MPEIAPTTEPEELVFRSLDMILVIARDEVVALVEVELRAVKFWRVEEAVAKIPGALKSLLDCKSVPS